MNSTLEHSKENQHENTETTIEYTVDDSSSESDGLEIDITESPKHTNEIDIEEIRVLENIEEEIERQYDEKAAKSNLTARNVKNILKHVITHEHVWEIVRNTAEGNENENFIYEPKFTRAKAKELLKTQSAAAIPWGKPKSNSEVHILINEELAEDSDDDEYIPSDDEKESYHPSDYDSQPATPATPTTPMHDTSTQTNWTEDGIFKIPTSSKKSPNKDTLMENIALRTRSKLSLSDTPLEKIEEAFIPPDITTDMYDLECDDDDWNDFLKQFTKPLDEAVHGGQEDDEEADPEYNVLADEEINLLDKEELRIDRAVKVSKKELNNLVAELFEFSEMFTNAKELEKLDQNTTTVSIENVEKSQTITITEEVFVTDKIPSEDNFEPIIIEESGECMTQEQILLLEQQMRQHIQMLAQNFVLTFQHPVLGHMSENFKNMLLSFNELSKYNQKTAINAANLQIAVTFITDWENMMRSNNDDAQRIRKYVNFVNKKYREARKKGTDYRISFPPELLKKVSECSAFMYPSLLPKIPFYCDNIVLQRERYVRSEDELMALGLEQFIPYMENDSHYKSKLGKLRLADVAYFIVKYMMPHKDPYKIYVHIKSQKDKNAGPNPIKHYFTNKKAPLTIHCVIPLADFGMLPPYLRSADSLPYQWKRFLYPELQILPSTNAKKAQKPPAYNTKPAIKKSLKVLTQNNSINSRNNEILHSPVKNVISEVRLQPLILDIETPALQTFNVQSQEKSKTFSKPILPLRRLAPKIEEVYVTSTPVKKIVSENEIRKTGSICKASPIKSVEQKRKLIYPSSFCKFKFNSSIFKNINKKDDIMLPSMPFLLTPVKDPSHQLETVEKSTDENNTVEKSLIEENTPDQVQLQDKADETDVISHSTQTQQNSKDDEEDLNALMIASSTVQQKNRRLQTNLTKKAKQMKEYNASLAMLCPENGNIIEEKAKNFAQAYYDKVQERLESESPLEYQKFMEALSEHDERRNSVSELYEKVSSVLSPKHSDLCEEFLTFLTPEQAQQIGKLVPHFLLSNMSLFLRKLEIYYNNQPAQLRRIYNSLIELSDNPNVTMDKVRSSILPLFKGNNLLTDWFLQMFPEEAPPESLMTDWEQVSCDDGDDINNDEHVFETLTLPEVEDPYGGPNCICKCHNIDDEMYASRARHCIPCGTKFLQGRVYVQTGKGLRLANVTFNDSPNIDHNTRLSVKPNVRQKRKSETSPSKNLMSPTKQDDEPKPSIESEDDVNGENITKKMKSFRSFRTNNSTKNLKKTKTKPTVKSKPKDIVSKSRIKFDIASPTSKKPAKSKQAIKKIEPEPEPKLDNKTIETDILKVDSVKNETNESESEVNEWDVKTSPGHSVESMDTCEESSQDTIDGHGSDTDDSIVEEIESALSENSEDSNSQQDEVVDSEKSPSWTRDEDKILLQTYQERGHTPNVFKDIGQLLAGRTLSEIRQRFHTLMSLLQKMKADPPQ